MKFDVVIGNPPYNKNVYLDFIEKGHQLLKDNGQLVMVTPAKFFYRLSENDMEFKRNMLKYFKNIVYFPDAGDVFDIRLQGGIAYFLLDKEEHEKVRVKNVCKLQPLLDSNGTWQERAVDNLVVHNDTVLSILSKIGAFSKEFVNCECTYQPKEGNWNLFVASVNGISSGGSSGQNVLSNSGNMTVLGPMTITDDGNFGSPDIRCFYSADTKDEVDSYSSYLNTKFVRFLLLVRMCSYHNDNISTWRFVPAQREYNHIFTDKELKEQYGLSDDEMKLIDACVVAR